MNIGWKTTEKLLMVKIWAEANIDQPPCVSHMCPFLEATLFALVGLKRNQKQATHFEVHLL